MDQVSPEGNGYVNGLLRRLADASLLRAAVPTIARQWCMRFVPESYWRARWPGGGPDGGCPPRSDYPARVDLRFGVLAGFATKHPTIVAACRDLGVPYELIDLFAPDWMERIAECECDAFLVHPCCSTTTWKQLYDERLRVLAHDFGHVLYPTYDELWPYESKRRMHYWLEANDVPHPRVWIFYSRDRALRFVETAPLPIVSKTDLGAGTSGVHIHRGRASLRRLVRRAFARGIALKGGNLNDRQYGCVLLQEYIPDAREWRMIRIGDSYFGYEKIRKGDFHSGSHLWNYDRPPSDLLDLLHDLTEKGGFTSMDVDVLVGGDGRLYVTELQSVFGMGHPYEMCVVDGEPGRMLRDPTTAEWRFEAGSFCQNDLWNLRVAYLVDQLCSQSSVPGRPLMPEPRFGR